MEGFSLKLQLRIDWSELDLFGHVNNVAIMKYVQAARINYLERIGLMQSQGEAGIGPILASAAVQFRKPIFYPGQVTVLSGVDSIRNTSFRMQHRILDDTNEIAAEGQDILVLYDYGRNAKQAIPAGLRGKIEKLERRDL